MTPFVKSSKKVITENICSLSTPKLCNPCIGCNQILYLLHDIFQYTYFNFFKIVL